jgi:hypothetical protein
MTEETRIITKQEYYEFKRLQSVVPDVVSTINDMNLTGSEEDLHNKKMKCINLLLNRKEN